MDKRIELKFSIEDGDSIRTVYETIKTIYDDVPEQFRDNAYLSVGGDSYQLYGNFQYSRPETDGERQKRERDERERAAARARDVYEREHAEFMRLKAKFEP